MSKLENALKEDALEVPSLGLGIDAGGTYTDAVVYDLQSDKLLQKHKALTAIHPKHLC